MKHDSAIYWPNGKGHRECTRGYADLAHEVDRLRRVHVADVKDAAAYNAYHAALYRLDTMEDHLGKVVRYGA